MRRDLLRALDMLSDEQLHFVPAPGLWSLGKVARHIAGAEDGWFRYVVTGELEAWPRFHDETYASVQAVKGLLTEVHARTERFLETLVGPDLDRAVKTPWGEQLSLRWIIWHVPGARDPPPGRGLFDAGLDGNRGPRHLELNGGGCILIATWGEED